MKALNPVTVVLLLVFMSVISVPALAAGEPVIAPEIERLIAEESIEAAKARYQELSQTDSLDLQAELLGTQALMGVYLQAGNEEAAQAVGEMMSDMTMKIMKQYMPGLTKQMEAQQEAKRQADAQRQREQQAEQQRQKEQLDKTRGQRRDDLLRFTGLYGEAGSSHMGRTIFVTVSCDGYLKTGPMWADIAPWWMRSASDLAFTHSDSSNDFSMEFETDDAGKGMRMRHTIDGVKSPLEWKQDLPEGWGKCSKDPGY